jgi:hypothetical protein
MMALVRLLSPKLVLEELCGRGVPRDGEIGALATDGVTDPLLVGKEGGDSRSRD